MSTLYLSRIRLRDEPDMRALAPLLVPQGGDERTHAGHRLVWSLFADGPDRRRDFLWREDGKGRWYTLSTRPPLDRANLFSVETKSFEPNLSAGDRLAFSLRANAVVQRKDVHGRPARHDVVMDALRKVDDGDRAGARPRLVREAGTAWLERQGAASGFRLAEPPTVEGYGQLRIPREDGRPARCSVLDFAGILEITDPAAFLARLAAGFGKARAFGCGLMLVKRA